MAKPYSLYVRRRKPYPRVRKSRKTVFTPAIWARWLVENPRLSPRSDTVTLHLRAGIAEFRDRFTWQVRS